MNSNQRLEVLKSKEFWGTFTAIGDEARDEEIEVTEVRF